LSSGLRINSAKDDPAGLIISEMLRSEMTSITQAVDNTERAGNVIATAEGALNEVSSLLNDVRDLIVEAASTGSLTAEEIDANQLQIDSAVESITRIANSTTFGGTQLLNGNMDFVIEPQADVAGEVASTKVYQASFGSSANVDLAYTVTTAATTASLVQTQANGNGFVIEVTGSKGSTTLSMADAADANAMAAQLASAVAASSDITGVTAAAAGANTTFASTEVGSDQFVNVRIVSGQTPTSIGGVAGATSGTDAGADVVGTVNGQSFVGDGDKAVVNNGNVKAEINFDSAVYADADTGTIRLTGGGAKFQIGQDINTNGQVRVGIQSVTASNLGGGTASGVLSSIVTGGTNSLLEGKQAEAAEIVDKAILDIATLRGRLGALQRNTLDTNINSLQVTLENLTSSESTIRDTDFAVETSQLTRNQILVQAGMSVLATANSTPQSVLSLLQG
jgi:flagellin